MSSQNGSDGFSLDNGYFVPQYTENDILTPEPNCMKNKVMFKKRIGLLCQSFFSTRFSAHIMFYMRTGNVKAFCNRAQNAFSSVIYFWTQSQWRRQFQVSCLLYFISTASYMKSFDEVFGLTASFAHQMRPCVGFHTSIRHKHVSE